MDYALKVSLLEELKDKYSNIKTIPTSSLWVLYVMASLSILLIILGFIVMFKMDHISFFLVGIVVLVVSLCILINNKINSTPIEERIWSHGYFNRVYFDEEFGTMKIYFNENFEIDHNPDTITVIDGDNVTTEVKSVTFKIEDFTVNKEYNFLLFNHIDGNKVIKIKSFNENTANNAKDYLNKYFFDNKYKTVYDDYIIE